MDGPLVNNVLCQKCRYLNWKWACVFFIGACALRFKNIYLYWQRNDNLAKMVAITYIGMDKDGVIVSAMAKSGQLYSTNVSEWTKVVISV